MHFHPPVRHVLRARDLIDARFAEPTLDVRAMADRAAMSQAHFSRAFKSAFGATPHQYLLRRRLEHAAWLLRTTDLSVTAVCLEVGLTSPTSFAASFRRRKGMSPREYRGTMPRHAPVDRLPLCWVNRVSAAQQDHRPRAGAPPAPRSADATP